jgi:prepilin-type N-terminal cleavage/methylation domain-containing protein
MSRSLHPMERVRRAARLRGTQSEGGFTLIELLVGLIILTIVSSIAFTVITQMMTEGQAITDTVVGIQQSDQANGSILQYLRGITFFTGASQTADTLTACSNVGYNGSFNGTTTTGTQPYGPDSDILTATWTPGSGKIDASFVVSITPTSDCVTGSARISTEYYARTVIVGGVTQPTFTYYKDNGAGGLTALATPVPPCAYPEIYAIGLQLSFLAGPQRPVEGYAADQASTLVTTIFLRNPTNTVSTTSSSTTSTTACPE